MSSEKAKIKRRNPFTRLILAGAVLVVALVVIFIASGFAGYVFDFDDFVRAQKNKNYTLEDIILKQGESKVENSFSLRLSEVKSENGKFIVKFTVEGKASFDRGSVVRTDSLRSKANAYSAEIYLLSGGEKHLLKCEKSTVSRATATYVYSIEGEFSPDDLSVLFSKLVMTEYEKK